MQRGSSVLDGNVDSVLAIKRQEKTLILHNNLEDGGKNRHQNEAPPREMVFEPIDIEINGFARQSAVIVPAPEQEPDALTGKQLTIIDAISAHGELKRDDLISITGISRATLYRHLSPMIKTAKIIYLREKDSYAMPFSQSHTQ